MRLIDADELLNEIQRVEEVYTHPNDVHYKDIPKSQMCQAVGDTLRHFRKYVLLHCIVEKDD